MKDLKELLCEIHTLTDENVGRLIAASEFLCLQKGEAIIKEGIVNTGFYILRSGVLRAYVPDGEREATIWFAVPGEIVFSAWGYVEGSPSKITVSASCDCSLLYYTKERIESLLESSPELVAWERKALMRLLLSTDQSLADFSIPCATDRYEVLLRKMPELLQYVPLKEIAGFLGVTPQSLSRIRARIVK